MRAATRRGTAGAVLAAGVLVAAQGAPAYGETTDEEVAEPDTFTSEFTAEAAPEEVVDDEGEEAPGEEGAAGTFNFQINSDEEVICYDYEFTGVTPPFDSPADTATHIHEGAEMEYGPPVIAFPDPEEGNGAADENGTADEDGTTEENGAADEETMQESGCMEGPFTTGVEDDEGNDTGEGFTLSDIEADPESFYADTHTEEYPDGAIRGQLEAVPGE